MLARAWLLHGYVDFVISRRPYEAWPEWMRITPPLEVSDSSLDGSHATDDKTGCVDRIVNLCEIAARRRRKPANCLRRCLVQRVMLVWACGVQANLCIGAKRDASAIAAHAWLEHQGRLINDHPENIGVYTRLEQQGATQVHALV